MKIENPVLTWGSLKGWNGIHVIGDYYNATAGREDLKASREGELATELRRRFHVLYRLWKKEFLVCRLTGRRNKRLDCGKIVRLTCTINISIEKIIYI